MWFGEYCRKGLGESGWPRRLSFSQNRKDVVKIRFKIQNRLNGMKLFWRLDLRVLKYSIRKTPRRCSGVRSTFEPIEKAGRSKSDAFCENMVLNGFVSE